METKIKVLENFLEEFKYTEEERCGVLDIYKRFELKKDAETLFDTYYIPYRDEQKIDFKDFTDKFNTIAALAEINPIELALPASMLLMTHSRTLYTKMGVSYGIWYDSMMDLKWKMYECRTVNHIFGHRSLNWNAKWLSAERFTLNRLQFEKIEYYNDDYSSENFNVKKGDPVINIHIPSDVTKKFDRENCEISYELARNFFKNDLPGRPILHCSSWLLYPAHSRILPESSNIRRFAEDFEINPSTVKESKNNLWRIFGTDEIYEDVNKYPEETGLQRCYKKFMLEGGVPGVAQGFKY